jgi:hypothetical protein
VPHQRRKPSNGNQSADQRRHSTAPSAHERPLDKTTMTLESNAPWRTNGRALSRQRVSFGAFQAFSPTPEHGSGRLTPNACICAKQIGGDDDAPPGGPAFVFKSAPHREILIEYSQLTSAVLLSAIPSSVVLYFFPSLVVSVSRTRASTNTQISSFWSRNTYLKLSSSCLSTSGAQTRRKASQRCPKNSPGRPS